MLEALYLQLFEYMRKNEKSENNLNIFFIQKLNLFRPIFLSRHYNCLSFSRSVWFLKTRRKGEPTISHVNFCLTMSEQECSNSQVTSLPYTGCQGTVVKHQLLWHKVLFSMCKQQNFPIVERMLCGVWRIFTYFKKISWNGRQK